MKTYKNHRSEPYFTFLKNGKKTIEGRICEGKYAQICAGEQIQVFTNDETDSVIVEIVRVTRYASFLEMLETEDLHKVLPDAKSVEHGAEVYRRFYSVEEEAKFGVVAIKVRLI